MVVRVMVIQVSKQVLSSRRTVFLKIQIQIQIWNTKQIQETRSANLWGSSPAEPSSTFFLQRYNPDSTFTGVLLCRGNLYNAVISTLADRLPGRQVWRSQQGKFRWCYQWISKSNCYNLVFMVTWISPIKHHQSGSRLLRHGWTVELLRQDPRHPRVIPFPKSNPLSVH